MTRILHNKLALVPGAANVLPEIQSFSVTTQEGDPLVTIGGVVVEAGRRDLDLESLTRIASAMP
jgi:hypothetical protein